MTILSASAALVRFKENEERFDAFINQPGTYTTDTNEEVETLQSFLLRASSNGMDVSNFASFAAAVADSSTANKALWVSSAVSCDNITFPTNRGLIVTKGGVITVNATKVLDMQGVTIDAGPYQIFAGSGSVVNLPSACPEWFGTDSAAFKKAVDSIKATGGTVFLGPVTYISPYYDDTTKCTKANVAFVGAKMPGFKSDATGLENGTIIQGTFRFFANGINIKNLGIDSGSAVCTALFGGAAMDGFIIGNANAHSVGLPYFTGFSAENIIAICKDSSSAVHAFLNEMTTGSSVRNINTKFGTHGIVFKCQHATGDGLHASDHASNGVIVKSDDYAISYDVVLSNITMANTTTYTGCGLRVTAATAALGNVNITNVAVDNGYFGISTGGTSSFPVEDVHINGVSVTNCRDANSYGIGIDNYCNYVTIANADVNSGVGKGFYVSSLTNYCNVLFSSSRKNSKSGFDVRGVGSKLIHCVSRNNGLYGLYIENPQWIQAGYFPKDAETAVGVFIGANGKLVGPDASAEIIVPTLLNSWVNYGGSSHTVGYWFEGGKVRLRGMVKSGAAGASIFLLNSGYRPSAPKRLVGNSFNGTALVLTEILIDTTGNVYMTYGANATLSGAYLSLDGIEFSTSFD